MRTIWKFNLHPDHDVTAHGGTPRVVHVGVDPASDPTLPTAWVELNPGEQGDLALSFIGTGHDVPIGWDHVGSTVAGPFVWHVYAKALS